ncbi:transposable element Tcb1 transposase [Trichonephila clavipes]|nr:transposable element Tcb1 transposase [Trichonephila clavipes]
MSVIAHRKLRKNGYQQKREKHTKNVTEDRLEECSKATCKPDLKKLICEAHHSCLQHQKDVNQKQQHSASNIDFVVWWWKHNGVGVFLVVWPGSVSSRDWKMNSEIYVDIMDNAALPTLRQYFGEGQFLFQQDNCSIHTSRLAQTWFDEMGVQKLDWPSQSPDLNPVEHLWDELERRLRSQPNRPSSLQALPSAVMNTWKAIPMVTYQKLVESLPKCVQAVIHAKGGPTSY